MSYDEDLSQNPIFQKLESRFPDLISQAPSKSLLICIPKSAIAQEIHSDLQVGDILNYVLKPYITSPESGCQVYQTLTKRKIEIKEKTLYLKQGFPEARTVHILFEETFYNEQDKSYQVLCIDQPFEGNPSCDTMDKFRNLGEMLEIK